MRHCKFEHNKENNPVIMGEDRGVSSDQVGEENTTQSAHKDRDKQNTETPSEEVEHSVNKGDKVEETKKREFRDRKGNGTEDFFPKKSRKFTGKNKRRENVMQFSCKQCGKGFSSKGRLREHAAFHIGTTKDKPICEVCGLECKHRRELKQHEISHDPNALQCSLCQKYFRRKGCLVFHLRNDHMLFIGEKWGRGTLQEFLVENSIPVEQKEEEETHQDMKGVKPICQVCGKEYDTYKALEEHTLTHDATAYQCQYCEENFELKQHLVSHLRKVHKIFERKRLKKRKISKGTTSVKVVQEDEPQEEQEPFHPELPKDMLGKQVLLTSKRPKIYKCKFCPQRFRDRSRVVKHEKVKHTNTGQYKCEFCSMTFTEDYRYILHKRKHTKERPFKCSECPLSFGSQNALMNHMPEHRGERPFACDFCGKGFSTRRYMNAHKRRQHRVPRVLHKCTFCEKTFKERSDLKRHEQRHKGIRPFVCLQCAKAFGTKSKLQAHERTHTGEKPFECHICKQRFALNHHLTAHLIFRHETERSSKETVASSSDKPSTAAR